MSRERDTAAHDPSLQAADAGRTTLHRPSMEGGLEATRAERGDYRDQLRSRRWNAAPLENPDAEPTDPRLAVAGVLVLSAVTLVVIVLGYASGFWG